MAAYEVRGKVRPGSIKVHIGKIAQISIDLHSTGGRRSLVQPGTCGERRKDISLGTWVGTIDFAGEQGYTEVQTRQAAVSLAPDLRGSCSPMADVLGNQQPGAGRLSAATAIASPYVQFSADKPGPGAAVDVQASELRFGPMRKMKILRAVRQSSPPESLSYTPSAATGSFGGSGSIHGAATYMRTVLATCGFTRGTWEGNLSVDLPGAHGTPLAGQQFTGYLHTPEEDQPPGPSSPCPP
jgi:hypothetical protein